MGGKSFVSWILSIAVVVAGIGFSGVSGAGAAPAGRPTLTLGPVGAILGSILMTPPDISGCRSGGIAANGAYGDVVVGTTSTQVCTVTNHGPLFAASVTASTTGSFGVSTASCPSALPPGGSCAISVTFTPVTTGAANGTLNVTFTALGLMTTGSSLALSGFGEPAVFLSGCTGAFPPVRDGSTADQSCSLTNVGPESTVGLSIAQPSGGPFSLIAVSGPGGCASLTPDLTTGASCAFVVQYAPDGTPGTIDSGVLVAVGTVSAQLVKLDLTGSIAAT